MVGLRKGHSYSTVKRPYTRKSRVKAKNFIKTIPQNKIIRHFMGDQKKKFEYRLNLVAKGPIQIRHNSLESCRQVVNRRLGKKFGSDYLFIMVPSKLGFFFLTRCYISIFRTIIHIRK